MAKPVGSKCNLDCAYCFYLEKQALFSSGDPSRIESDLLENYIKSYIEAQPVEEVSFAWQGGEPTLLGISYFQRIVELQAKHAHGKRIINALQTNGTLLDDKWGEFLAKSHFLVGVSIDGPEELHNKHRLDLRSNGSFDKVMRGIRILQKHGVEWNSLTCVHAANAQHALKVYKFLRGIGSRYLQFIPIVEREANDQASKLGLSLSTPAKLDAPCPDSTVMPWSVKPRGYGDFLISIFDYWIRRHVGKTFVQIFDMAFAKWLGMPGGLCVFDETCGRAVALERDGSIYSCDHYVYPEFKLGNVARDSIADMIESPQQKDFGYAKRSALPRKCLDCRYRFACNGGCPKHRFDPQAPGLNYLCRGYYRFFQHADPYLRAMADLYRHRQPPAAIMERIKRHGPVSRN